MLGEHLPLEALLRSTSTPGLPARLRGELNLTGHPAAGYAATQRPIESSSFDRL
jgi:hypothetical protein